MNIIIVINEESIYLFILSTRIHSVVNCMNVKCVFFFYFVFMKTICIEKPCFNFFIKDCFCWKINLFCKLMGEGKNTK